MKKNRILLFLMLVVLATPISIVKLAAANTDFREHQKYTSKKECTYKMGLKPTSTSWRN